MPLERMIRVESAWQKPWLLSAGTQIGKQHYNSGKGLEDSYRLGSTDNILWMVVADGVSDVPHAGYGARAATDAVAHHLKHALAKGTILSNGLVEQALAAAAETLVTLAKENDVKPIAFACTLALAIIDEHQLAAAVVGDSSVVTLEQGNGDGKQRLVPFCCGSQPNGRGTYTMASANWQDKAQVAVAALRNVDAVIVATDGANSYFSEPTGNGSTHRFTHMPARRFATVFDVLSARTFTNSIDWYLKQDKSDKSDDDDRTLAVALRVPEPYHPPYHPPTGPAKT